MIKILGFNFLIAPLVKLALFVCVVTGVILLAVYFYRFHNNFSKSNSAWGEFGDYIGGILGTILSFVNLLLFAFLTYRISNEDHHRWITQIRIDSYKELIKKLNAVRKETMMTKAIVEESVTELSISDFNNYFFLSGNEEVIIASIQSKLIGYLIKINVALTPASKDSPYYMSPPNRGKMVVKEFENYLVVKKDLIAFLGRIIMKKDTDEFRQTYLAQAVAST